MERILVSSCLLGRPVRYDGAAKPVQDALFERWRTEGRLVPVCPEVAGGLPVPRPAAEIIHDGSDDPGAAVLEGRARIRTADGLDVTDAFLRGAEHALATARAADVRLAVLKERSPSCGSRHVYDGTFSGGTAAGQGVTAALLSREGLRVFTEGELPDLAAILDSDPG